MQQLISFFILFVQFLSIFFSGRGLAVAPVDAGSEMLPVAQRCEVRAKTLADSYYNNCYMIAENRLLMHVGQATSTASCWEYCGLFSLCVAMEKLDCRYILQCNRALEGLQYYRHLNADGSFGGYAVRRAAIKGAADNAVAYDDNMWLCGDLVTLYEQTGNARYLALAQEIADFLLQEAYVELSADMLRTDGFPVPDAVGGFCWDYNHDALHACSNGPAVYSLAALYRLTGEEKYLTGAMRAWNFLQCLVSEEGVFYDLMALHKDENNVPIGVMGLDAHFYSYNSGSPIRAAVELYKATEEESYLTTAAHWAQCAYTYFAADTDKGVKQYPDGNVWFNLILLNGFCALEAYDESCADYVDSVLASIDYAYDNYRLLRSERFGGLFLPRSWTNGFSENAEDDTNTLTVSANAEVYAKLAAQYAGR